MANKITDYAERLKAAFTTAREEGRRTTTVTSENGHETESWTRMPYNSGRWMKTGSAPAARG